MNVRQPIPFFLSYCPHIVGGELALTDFGVGVIGKNRRDNQVRFNLYCLLDGGATWTLIAKKLQGTYNIDWQVPNVTEDKNACLIRVIGYNATRTVKIGADISNKPFTIKK